MFLNLAPTRWGHARDALRHRRPYASQRKNHIFQNPSPNCPVYPVRMQYSTGPITTSQQRNKKGRPIFTGSMKSGSRYPEAGVERALSQIETQPGSVFLFLIRCTALKRLLPETIDRMVTGVGSWCTATRGRYSCRYRRDM